MMEEKLASERLGTQHSHNAAEPGNEPEQLEDKPPTIENQSIAPSVPQSQQSGGAGSQGQKSARTRVSKRSRQSKSKKKDEDVEIVFDKNIILENKKDKEFGGQPHTYTGKKLFMGDPNKHVDISAGCLMRDKTAAIIKQGGPMEPELAASGSR